MARRAIALLSLLLAPCGLASQLSRVQLRSSFLKAKNAPEDISFSFAVPDIETDISRAQDTLANVNSTWAYVEEVFLLANQTVLLFANGAMAKLDEMAPSLSQVQSAADAIDSQPFGPGNTGGIIQDLVGDFIREVHSNADVARGRMLDAEHIAVAAIQHAKETIRPAVEAVLLAFDELLGKVIEAADTLDVSATSAAASASLFQEVADSSNLDARGWPFGNKKSVWDAAMVDVGKANESLSFLADQIDGINVTLKEVVVAPLVTATEGSTADFATTCTSAAALLPGQVSSTASGVCSAATDFSDVFTDSFGRLEDSAGEEIKVATALLGPVYDLVASLADLIGKAQAACGILKEQKATAL